MMDAFVSWMQTTSLSHAIVSYLWVWPAAESAHFIGLALIIGTVGFFDLRLAGAFKSVPVSAAHDLMPFALVGFAVNGLTGLIFLIGHPEQYAHNVAWWWKVACLALAGVNAVVFEFTIGKRTVQLGAGEDTPVAAKAIGVISILAWFGVLFWGRMLPFIGNAY